MSGAESTKKVLKKPRWIKHGLCLWKSPDPSFGLCHRWIAKMGRILPLPIFTSVTVWCWSVFCPFPPLEFWQAMWLAFTKGMDHMWLCADSSLWFRDFAHLVCSLKTQLLTYGHAWTSLREEERPHRAEVKWSTGDTLNNYPPNNANSWPQMHTN